MFNFSLAFFIKPRSFPNTPLFAAELLLSRNSYFFDVVWEVKGSSSLFNKNFAHFFYAAFVLFVPASAASGAVGATRRLQNEKIREDFSPGAWGSPQQDASVREWSPEDCLACGNSEHHKKTNFTNILFRYIFTKMVPFKKNLYLLLTSRSG